MEELGIAYPNKRTRMFKLSSRFIETRGNL